MLNKTKKDIQKQFDAVGNAWKRKRQILFCADKPFA